MSLQRTEPVLRHFFTWLLLITCSRSSSPSHVARTQAALSLRTAELTVKNQKAQVEIADNETTRTRGLMFRTSLGRDSGMLFVFNDDQPRSFWMHNTYLPLSIAFLDSVGVVINILEMAPLDTTVRYVSTAPARYALEMNSDWFAAHAIRPGDTVFGLPR